MSSQKSTNISAARPLNAGAIALMLMLCLSWGFNQVAVKLALPDIPPMLQATNPGFYQSHCSAARKISGKNRSQAE